MSALYYAGVFHDILFHPLGLCNAKTASCWGAGYQFWSGIGAFFLNTAIFAWVYVFLRRHNCHVRGCWRIGRHPVEDTIFVVCRRHHPDDKPTAEDVRKAAQKDAEGVQ